MKQILFLLLFYVVGFSSQNTFFVVEEKMSLLCEDVVKIKKINEYISELTYTESGRKKINAITANNVGKKLGLIVDDKVIFFNIGILEPMATDSNMIDFGSQYKGNIDLFIKSFDHCNFKK